MRGVEDEYLEGSPALDAEPVPLEEPPLTVVVEIPFAFICNACQHEQHSGSYMRHSTKEFIGMHQQLDKSLHLYTFPCSNCNRDIKLKETAEGPMEFVDFTARRKVEVEEESDGPLEKLFGSELLGSRTTDASGEIILTQKCPTGENKERVQMFYAKVDDDIKLRMIERERELNQLRRRQDEFYRDNASRSEKMIEDLNERKTKSRENASHIVSQLNTMSKTASSTRRKIRQSSIFGQRSASLTPAIASGHGLQTRTLKQLSESQQKKERKRKRQLDAFRESQKRKQKWARTEQQKGTKDTSGQTTDKRDTQKESLDLIHSNR